MLEDCLDIFEKEYKLKGDPIILDKYTPDSGLYLLVNSSGVVIKTAVVDDKGTNRHLYKDFIEMDYLSRLLDMNKPIDKKKTVKSNNYLSFWVKILDLIEDPKTKKIKLDKECIDRYFDTLATIERKYKDKHDKNLYETVLKDVGEIDLEKLERCRAWVEENIFTLLDKYSVDKKFKYVKVFFDADIELYRRESNRYVYPNLFNSNDYNEYDDGVIYGLPNNNMGMNSKKPYLKRIDRNIKVPFLVSLEKAIIMKKFFDYLACLVDGEDKRLNLYIGDDNGLDPISDAALKDKKFDGIYLRLAKEKNEVEIVDYDIISNYTPNLKDFFIKEIIPRIDKKTADNDNSLVYKEVTKLDELRTIISGIFFNKFLVTNFFTPPKNIRLSDMVIKDELIKTRAAYFDWFYKNDKNRIINDFEDSSLRLIKNSVFNGYDHRARDQFNLRNCINLYLKGSVVDMSKMVEKSYEELSLKIIAEEFIPCETDAEYYFAIGQISYYLLSQSNSSKRNMSEIDFIINCKTNTALLQRLERLFKKYSYSIPATVKKFRKLYSMILAYTVTKEQVDDNMVLAGYLFSNMLFIKSDNNQNLGVNIDEQ